MGFIVFIFCKGCRLFFFSLVLFLSLSMQQNYINIVCASCQISKSSVVFTLLVVYIYFFQHWYFFFSRCRQLQQTQCNQLLMIIVWMQHYCVSTESLYEFFFFSPFGPQVKNNENKIKHFPHYVHCYGSYGSKIEIWKGMELQYCLCCGMGCGDGLITLGEVEYYQSKTDSCHTVARSVSVHRLEPVHYTMYAVFAIFIQWYAVLTFWGGGGGVHSALSDRSSHTCHPVRCTGKQVSHSYIPCTQSPVVTFATSKTYFLSHL